MCISIYVHTSHQFERFDRSLQFIRPDPPQERTAEQNQPGLTTNHGKRPFSISVTVTDEKRRRHAVTRTSIYIYILLFKRIPVYSIPGTKFKCTQHSFIYKVFYNFYTHTTLHFRQDTQLTEGNRNRLVVEMAYKRLITSKSIHTAALAPSKLEFPTL